MLVMMPIKWYNQLKFVFLDNYAALEPKDRIKMSFIRRDGWSLKNESSWVEEADGLSALIDDDW